MAEHEPLSTEHLTKIREREERLPKEKWTTEFRRSIQNYVIRCGESDVDCMRHHERDFADFIAHARQDIPDLLTTIEARDAEVVRLRWTVKAQAEIQDHQNAEIATLTAAIKERINVCDDCRPFQGLGRDNCCHRCADLRAVLDGVNNGQNPKQKDY